MTSLQRQLEKLRIPQTKIIQLQEKKKKASFLFDREEAANLDRQTFYEIGINGLQKLEHFDKEFSKFHSDLFSESSILFNRSVQDSEINEKLDVIIKRFLLRLSPYFLLKPAHQALEWLIQRFNINYYNVNELMLCVLPYHEDKLFVQVVRLFSLSKKDQKWGWLSDVQKNGVHLSRQTVINRCLSNASFLSFIQKMVSDYVAEFSNSSSSEPQLRHVFAFYTQVVSGMLDQKELSEAVVGRVLPFLEEGLCSNLVDYKASSLMVLSLIFVRSKLEKQILETLIYTVVKFTMKSKAIFEEALCCLVLLFQTQHLTRLKKKICRNLVNYPKLVPVLEKLGKDYKLDNFLMALFHNLVPKALSNCLKLYSCGESSEGSVPEFATPFKRVLTNILRHIPMDSSTSCEVASCVIRAYMEHAIEIKHHHREQFQGNVCEIMRVLEARHAVALDQAVQHYLDSNKKSKTRKIIFNLLNSSLESSQHKLLPGVGATLTTSLYHPLPQLRIQALIFLKEEQFNVADDATFYEEALSLRLADDDPKVVEAVLQLNQKLWLLSDSKTLINSIKILLMKADTEPEWQFLKAPALDMLLTCTNTDLHTQVIALFAPYLLQLTTDDETFFKTVVNSPFAITNSFPKEKSTDPKQYLLEVVSHQVSEAAPNKSLATLNLFLDHLPTDSPRRLHYLCFMLDMFAVLYKQLEKRTKSTFDLCLSTLKIIKEILSKKSMAQCKSFHEAVVLTEQAVNMRKGAHIKHCAAFLETFIYTLQIVDSLTEGTIFWEYQNKSSAHDTCIQLIIQLFVVLVKYTEKYKKFAASNSNLVNVFFGELVRYDIFDKFLCFLWSADMQHQSAHIISQQQLGALKTGYIWIKSVDPNYVQKWMLSPVPVMVSMLAALASKMAMIRKAAASCIRVVYPKGHRKSLPYHYFLKKLIANLDRIESQEDLPQVIGLVMNYEACDDSDCSEKDADSSSRKRTVKDIFDVMIMETTPFYIIRSMLEAFKEYNDMTLLCQLQPLLHRLLDRLQSHSLTRCQHDSLNLLLLRYNTDIASNLTVESQAFKLFGRALCLKNCANQKQQLEIQEFVIKLINKDFYLSLPSDASQQQLMSHLFTALVESDTVGTPELIRKLIKHFSIKSSYLLNELDIFESQPVCNTVRENKKLQMLSGGGVEANELDTLSWQRVIVVLEILQNKKKLRQPEILLPICFRLLSRVLEVEENNSAEYLKQLLLSCICNISNHMINIPEQLAILQTQKFDMELIVKCIRTSSSPQTHHHALLLLTVAAKIDPEMLLHNVMAVFTFVGGTMVRQDDTYSFSMIYRTLETVIPALLAACEERVKYQNADVETAEDIIPMVLKVFVDAFPHIPAHRRIMLFKELSRIISQGRHLSCLLLLFVEHVVVHSVPKDQSVAGPQSPESLPPELEFALNLSFQFPAVQQLDAIRDSLMYLSTLPTEIKSSGEKKKSVSGTELGRADTEIFNTDYHTPKQLRHFKYSSVNFFVSLLERTEFISQIANTPENKLQEHYEKLLEVVFNYLSSVSKTAEQQQQQPTSRFWKILLSRVSHLLDKVCTLLPNKVFINVISTLITHPLVTVQKKSMDLLNSKLTEEIPQSMHSMLLPLVKKLTDIVEEKVLTENTVEDSSIVISQTAMYSLKLLCRQLTSNAQTELDKTLSVSIDVLRQRGDSSQLMACSLLCIAEICSISFDSPIVLKQLPLLMPFVLELLQKTDFLLRNSLLLLSTVTTLQRLLQSHSAFLSPYIGNILDYICYLSCEKSIDIPNLVLRLKGVCAIIASKVPSRILVNIISKQYSVYLTKNKSYIGCLMAILTDHISNSMSSYDLKNQSNSLEQFFRTCIEFRLNCKASSCDRDGDDDHHSADDDDDDDLTSVALPSRVPRSKSGDDDVDVDGIEEEIIKSIISFVMKLSESKFKPLFLKFYDWCKSYKSKQQCLLIFYRLADSLAVSLRGLFLIFAGHIVEHMAEVLEQYNKDKNPDLKWKENTSTLLTYVIDCAHKCFLYDTEGFVTEEVFRLLMVPLADQLSNMHDKKCDKRITDHLIPCLSQLAISTHDDTLWKALNYQVLLKTKHSSVNVRLASLTMISELHKKLGESYLNLLPETVPFLAELMEDECEAIEKKCQEVLCEMEKTLGEPLQKYF